MTHTHQPALMASAPSLNAEDLAKLSKPSKRRRYTDECIQASEAAVELGLTRQRVSDLVDAGQLFAVYVGTACLIPRDEVERFKLWRLYAPADVGGRPKSSTSRARARRRKAGQP